MLLVLLAAVASLNIYRSSSSYYQSNRGSYQGFDHNFFQKNNKAGKVGCGSYKDQEFKEYKADDGNGGAVDCFKPNETQMSDVHIEKCKFINCKAGHNGGAVHSECSNDVTIINSIFQYCSASKNAHAININGNIDELSKIQTNVLIQDCSFNSCGDCKSVIVIKGPSILDGAVNIQGCNFYNDESRSRALEILSRSNCTIENCKFNYCIGKNDTGDLVNGGALLYFHQGNDDYINMTNCSYIGCEGNPEGEAFYISTKTDLILTSCYFSKPRSKCNYYMFLQITKRQNEQSCKFVKFEDCIFDEVFTSDRISFGGMSLKMSGNVEKFYFIRCSFLNVYKNGGSGGAIQFGEGKYSWNYDVLINECLFDNCHTLIGDYGGAIYIDNTEPVEICNTKFINCKSDKKGGAIYVNRSTSSLKIHDCEFINSNSLEGCAIFLNTNLKKVQIQNILIKNDKKDESQQLINSSLYVHQIKNIILNNITFENMNCIGNDGSAGLSITPNNGEDTEQSIILSSLNFINCGSGTAFIVNKIGITLYGCEFTINEETSKSSGILIQNPWGCYLYNCTFTKCEGNLGGALCSETDKEIHVIDTRFISNKASINGGSIHIVNQEAVVILEGSHFDSCFSTNIGAGSISLENCIKILSIENCKFSNQQSAYCIMLNADIINFMNNFFENCFCNDKKYGGAGIYLANGKDYKFNNITFSNCIPNSNENSKAYLVIPGDFKNTLELIGCHFRGKGVYDDNDKAIFISNQETKLVLQSCEFLNLKTQKGSGCAIGSHSNSFECENCQFTECSGWSVFHFWKLLDISFKNVIFKNCVAACKTGFIYHEVAESFELLNCSVIGCKSQFLGSNPKYDGGAIRIHDGVQSVKIELCEFKDCTGTVTFQIKPMGGCIRISDSVTSVSISSCSFSRSSAYSGNALYFGNNQEASYNIFNSSFSDNSNPGEVIFSHSSLDITNCTIEFTSNSQACTGIIGNKYLKLTNVIFINCKVNKPINSKIFSNKYTRHQKTLLENSKSMNEDSTYNKDDGGAVKCFEKVEIKMCRFEKCVAQTGYGGAIYCKLVEDSFIEDSIFGSNTANQAGAIFIQSSNFFSLKNNRFLYNDAQTSASSFIFNIDGDVNIELCNFTSILNENEIYQCAFINIGDILWIHVRPKITLDSCYFVCENPNGLEVDNVLHLFSSSESKVILQKDVCFDCPQERAIKLSNMELLENNIGEGAFNCLGGELLPTTIEDDDPNVKTKTENPTQKPEATVYPNNSDVPSIDIIPSSTLDSSCSNGGTVEDEDLLGITKTTSFIIVSVVVVVIIIIIIIIVLVRKKKSDKSDKKSKSKRHNKSDIESSKHKTRKEKKSKKKKETSDPPSEQHETLTSDSDEILDPITRAYESSSNYDDRFFDNDDIPQYNVDPLDRSSSSDENSEWINRYEL